MSEATTEYRGRRITPDEVEAAYRETGLEPGRNHYKDVHGCGCGIGAMLCQALGIGPGEGLPLGFVLDGAEVSRNLGIDDNYRVGFIWGFDGAPIAAVNPATIAGQEDGIACAARVFGKGAKS